MTSGLSYVHGASEAPLLGVTVSGTLDRTAAKFPDGEALVSPHQNIRWTYAELKQRVDELAAGLLALDLQVGERIGICAPNDAEWVVTQFATAKAGLILVNINPAYRLGELEYALRTVGCSALIVAEKLKTSDYIQMLNELMPELASSEVGKLKSESLPNLRLVIRLGEGMTPGMLNFSDIPRQAGPAHRKELEVVSARLQFDDPINIQFTSGTTGTPKAATLSHHNIVNNAYFVGRQMRLGPDDRMCIPVPMYHCFGMVLGTLCCVAHGSTMVFSSEGFDARAVLATVDAERCSVLHGVPTMFIAELDRPDFAEFDLTSLRTGVMAGAPCPIELMKRVMHEMYLDQITIAYGMTETGPVSFETSVDDPVKRRVETVGRVLPHIEIKIVDRRRTDRAARRAWRASDSRLLRHAVLLERSGADRQGHRCGALDRQRRYRGARRRGLLSDRRADQGHADPRRRKPSFRVRSRNFCTSIPRSSRSRSLACPIPSTARKFAPGSSCAKARRAAKRKCETSVVKRSRISKSQGTSSLLTNFL